MADHLASFVAGLFEVSASAGSLDRPQQAEQLAQNIAETALRTASSTEAGRYATILFGDDKNILHYISQSTKTGTSSRAAGSENYEAAVVVLLTFIGRFTEKNELTIKDHAVDIHTTCRNVFNTSCSAKIQTASLNCLASLFPCLAKLHASELEPYNIGTTFWDFINALYSKTVKGVLGTTTQAK